MKKLFFFSLVALMSTVMLTGNNKSVDAAGYGSAGCGLGSMVFGTKPGFVQIFAATTNGTFASQTFGITSGTSNCGQGLVAMNNKQNHFVAVNLDKIKADSAKGSGETIKAYSSLLGCSAGSEDKFASLMQKNFAEIFGKDAAPEQINNSVKNLLSMDKELKLSCQVVLN